MTDSEHNEASAPITPTDGGSDTIARCLVPTHALRLVATMTTQTAREAARRHGAVGAAAATLARAGTAGALLATLTKGDERLTVQLRGDGPSGTVTVDVSSTNGVRTFIKNPQAHAYAPVGVRVPLAPFIGRTGLVSVVRDLGLKDHVGGQTDLVSGEIDLDIEHYLINSEQIDSAVGCEALLGDDLDVQVSGGILVQTLPDPSGEGSALVATIRNRLRDGILARVMATKPLPTAESLARATVGDLADALQVLEIRPTHFHCPCSRERAGAALAMIGTTDQNGLLDDDGGASVVCEFCRESYRFSAAEVSAANGGSDRS